METFFYVIVTISSLATLILSALRLYLEWKRFKNTAWETTVRLMASDHDARVRSDDFADLYTALRYLEKHPDCLSDSDYRTLNEAMHSEHVKEKKATCANGGHCLQQKNRQ